METFKSVVIFILSILLTMAVVIIVTFIFKPEIFCPSKTVVEAETIPCAPVPCTPITKEIPCSTPVPEKNCVDTTDWVGDNFGPEKPFPANNVSLAIAELWNPQTGFCALVKINEGETLNWKHSGAYWNADSQEALEARWPHHKQEYMSKEGNQNCQTLTDINLIPPQ